MTISLTGDALPNQQYFIGSFDGKTFKNDCCDDTELWLEYGPDSYAGIVFNQVPNGRRIFISWMNKWEYATNLNFNIWNGQMGIPREFKLKLIGDQIRLSSLPVNEFKKLRTKRLVKKRNVSITNDYVYKIATNVSETTEALVDIVLTLDLMNFKANDSFDIVFSDQHDKLKISFKEKEFTLDRSKTGRANFPNFASSHIALDYLIVLR